MTRHLVLVGMMGSGKTTVGRLVAARLGRPFVDSDEVIQARTGRTVREIFADDGETAFRALETEALDDALAAPGPAVIAAAGGTVLAASNRRRLRDGEVVWLDADPELLVERVTTDGHRPLLDDDPGTTLVRLAVERRALYEEVADHVVHIGGRTPDEVADEILAVVA
jgi:shikimate kinase